MSGQGYDVVVLSFRLNSREPLPQLLARVLNVSLAEAKSYAKGFPFLVRQGITQEAAEVVQQALEAAGARVSVEPHRSRPASSAKRIMPDTHQAPGAAQPVVVAPAPSAPGLPVQLGSVAVVSMRVQAPEPAAPPQRVVEIGQPAGIPTLRLGSEVSTKLESELARARPIVIEAPTVPAVIPAPKAAEPAAPTRAETTTAPTAPLVAAGSPAARASSPTQPLAELPVFADDQASNDNALFAAVPDMTSGFALPGQDEPRAEPAVIVAVPDSLEEVDGSAPSGLELDVDPSRIDPAQKPRSIKRTGPMPQARPADTKPAEASSPTEAAPAQTHSKVRERPSQARAGTASEPTEVRLQHSKDEPEASEPMPWGALLGLACGALMVVWFLLR